MAVGGVRSPKAIPGQIMPPRTLLLTPLALMAFAANSLLCRAALKQTSIDAASFTAIRIVAGAVVLGMILLLRKAPPDASRLSGSWLSALALFGYAICFSLAYVKLPAATGALILFGSVQASMIGYGLWRGERLRLAQTAGLCVALAGLVWLLLPGVAAPPPGSAVLMACAGVAWGAYSLRGRGVADPTAATAGNFLRAVPFALGLSVVLLARCSLDAAGVSYAVASGALTSGLGYVVWYAVLPGLVATTAATVQLSVPVLTALGGVLLLGEPLTMRLALCSAAILGGIGLVVGSPKPNAPAAS